MEKKLYLFYLKQLNANNDYFIYKKKIVSTVIRSIMVLKFIIYFMYLSN